MKSFRKTICRFFCFVLLFSLISLPGCDSGPKADTDQSVTETFEELLAADYQVDYLIFGDGLEVDLEALGELDPRDYAPVTTQEYTTRAGLEKRLKEVYALDETVKGLLSAKDSEGRERLQVRDGALWRATATSAFPYETVEGSIVLRSRTDTAASFVFEETGLDGSLYETALSMAKTARGWRLNGTRKDAQRTLLREGSGEDSAIPAGAARKAAEEFLATIQSGDVSAISQAIGYGNDTTVWQQMKVTAAEITAAAEDLDSYGDYTVRLTVEDGAGVFPEGTGDYRLLLSCNEMRWGGDRPIPWYFRPASEQHLETRWSDSLDEKEWAPALAVSDFIGWFGQQIFTTPEELPPETLVEYAMIRTQPEDPEMVFTPQEIDTAIQRLFGITGFDGKQTKFYSKEKNGYLIWGRGGSFYNTLTPKPKTANGQSQVDVTLYRDPLCTMKLRTVRYTMAENEDGSWRFVSAIPVE